MESTFRKVDSQSTPTRPPPSARAGSLVLPQQPAGIKTDRMAYTSVVGDIEASLAALKFRDLGLVRSNFSRELPLGHADLFAAPNEALDDTTVEAVGFRVLAGHVHPRRRGWTLCRSGILCRIDLSSIVDCHGSTIRRVGNFAGKRMFPDLLTELAKILRQNVDADPDAVLRVELSELAASLDCSLEHAEVILCRAANIAHLAVGVLEGAYCDVMTIELARWVLDRDPSLCSDPLIH